MTRKQREVLIKNGYDTYERLLEREKELAYVLVNKEIKEVLELKK